VVRLFDLRTLLWPATTLVLTRKREDGEEFRKYGVLCRFGSSSCFVCLLFQIMTTFYEVVVVLTDETLQQFALIANDDGNRKVYLDF
jgi:hypothetical protein